MCECLRGIPSQTTQAVGKWKERFWLVWQDTRPQQLYRASFSPARSQADVLHSHHKTDFLSECERHPSHLHSWYPQFTPHAACRSSVPSLWLCFQRQRLRHYSVCLEAISKYRACFSMVCPGQSRKPEVCPGNPHDCLYPLFITTL